MAFHAVIVDSLEHAIELFVDRQVTELMVENRDEPGRAGEVSVERVVLKTLSN